MNAQETATFIKDVISVYPTYFWKSDPADAVKTWQDVLKDVEYQYAYKGLIELAKEATITRPSIGDLYARARQVERYEYLDKGGIIYTT